LEEAGEREHVLSAEEEDRLFAALRPDYHAMFRFALVTGLRLGNVVALTWAQIDWDARSICSGSNRRSRGGELHYVPITPAVAAILSLGARPAPGARLYLCLRPQPPRSPPRLDYSAKAIRYPFTHDGWRKAWKAALEAAGIADFRFHDLRHTAGTRALHAHRNLKTVQRMLDA
jgi:integrase